MYIYLYLLLILCNKSESKCNYEEETRHYLLIPTRRKTLFYCLPIKMFTDEYMERMKEEGTEEREKGRVGGRKEKKKSSHQHLGCLKYHQ